MGIILSFTQSISLPYTVLPAAIAAGARMDATYHPGVWQSVKYTCCDAVNKRAGGCKPTTQATEKDSETAVKRRQTSEPAASPMLPPPVPKKRNNTRLVCLVRLLSVELHKRYILLHITVLWVPVFCKSAGCQVVELAEYIWQSHIVKGHWSSL